MTVSNNVAHLSFIGFHLRQRREPNLIFLKFYVFFFSLSTFFYFFFFLNFAALQREAEIGSKTQICIKEGLKKKNTAAFVPYILTAVYKHPHFMLFHGLLMRSLFWFPSLFQCWCWEDRVLHCHRHHA